MFKLFLISIIVVPVLLGWAAASDRSARRGLTVFLAFLITYDILYLLLLLYLRRRWVG